MKKFEQGQLWINARGEVMRVSYVSKKAINWRVLLDPYFLGTRPCYRVNDEGRFNPSVAEHQDDHRLVQQVWETAPTPTVILPDLGISISRI